MDIKTAICQRRTIRRFQNKPVDRNLIAKLVNVSRLYASGANLQPIRFVGITESILREEIFKTLRWAAYLPDFEIRDDQKPMAYVVLTCDTTVKKNCQFDLGAAATTLMLAAEGEGLATCCLGSFDANTIKSLLSLDETVEPLLVIAIGYPDQRSRVVDMMTDVKYYEDSDGCLCVPKRTLEEVLKMY